MLHNNLGCWRSVRRVIAVSSWWVARAAVALADKTYVLVGGDIALQGGKELAAKAGFAKAFLGG